MGDLGFGQRLGGVQIYYSEYCTEPDGWNFPSSKHRSQRVFKKLLKRFGSWERRKPCMYQSPAGIYAHPVFKAEIERLFQS